MLVVFNSEAIIHHEFIPEDQNVSSTIYRNILYCLP